MKAAQLTNFHALQTCQVVSVSAGSPEPFVVAVQWGGLFFVRRAGANRPDKEQSIS